MTTPIHIEDRPFQIFCFGRYMEPPDGEPLTEVQKRVLQAMRKCEGDEAETAKSLGISRYKVQSHVSLIRSKGWKV